jgi:RimJ/RimL family protein N-acetyltransferase
MTAGPSVSPLGPRLLQGRWIALEPFDTSHEASLRRATDAETFRYFPTPNFDSWLAKVVADTAEGTRICFVARNLADGAILGSTSYFDAVEKDGRVEIGSTWYGAGSRGTKVNPEAKLLLLSNAFDAGYHCVVLRTDSKNARSRAAILKLGAKQDGILRAAVWMPQGYFRDSVFFSILADEWPSVRAGLERRLA